MGKRFPKPARYKTSMDQKLGIRACGLILYGALPANLALIGIVDLKREVIINVSLGLILPVSLLPVLLIFLLVLSRHRKWYLTRNYLIIRSTLASFLILAIATAICIAANLIHHRTSFIVPGGCSPIKILSWVGIDASLAPLPVLKRALGISYLMAVASLALTSTLFMTVLTNRKDLPGLPGTQFLNCLGEVRRSLWELQNGDTWKETLDDDRHNDSYYNKLIEEVQLVISELARLASIPEARFAKSYFERIQGDLPVLEEALTTIRNSRGQARKDQRESFFGFPKKGEHRQPTSEQLAIERLRQLPLGA